MKIKSQKLDTPTEIAIRLDKVDSVLAILFERFSGNDMNGIDPRHLECLVLSAQEDIDAIRKMS